jgi:hypothetical protein
MRNKTIQKVKEKGQEKGDVTIKHFEKQEILWRLHPSFMNAKNFERESDKANRLHHAS